MIVFPIMSLPIVVLFPIVMCPTQIVMFKCLSLILNLLVKLKHFSIIIMFKLLFVLVGIYILYFDHASLTLRGSIYKPMLFTNTNAIPVKGITLVIRLVHLMLELVNTW